MFADLSDLMGALEEDELIPFFQPIVELRTGRLTGFEVLARWQHPAQGPILPRNFVRLAEHNGLIQEFTKQILQKAFLAAPLLPGPLSLAINISAVQLRERAVVPFLRELAREADFPLERLHIEITESAFLDSIEVAQAVTCELKELGCNLVLDDFGTGFSSLRYLQSLPFDTLKVDASFVRSMSEERESRKIVAAIVGLGHSLGLNIVAEGIETAEQAEALSVLGCRMGQGWLFGKPQPMTSIPAMLAFPAPISKWGPKLAVSSLEAFPTQGFSQLQAIYQGAPVGLCFLDRELRYVNLNQRAAELSGVPVAAHIGRSVKDVYPELYSRLENYLNAALKGQTLGNLEIHLPPLGSRVTGLVVLLFCQSAFDEAGEVIGISLSAMDITERKCAVEELREWKEMVELGPDVPWILDAQGKCIEVGRRWGQLTGMTREYALTHGFAEALHPEDLDSIREAILEAIRTNSPIDVRFRLKLVDGSWRWMRSQGEPRYRQTCRVTRWYGRMEEVHALPESQSP